MLFIDILIIAFGMAMDAFAVSISSGTKEIIRGFRPTFRLSFHFGLFQFIMPILGWFLGSRVAVYIESVDHWIAFGLLSFVGVKMIHESMKKNLNGEEFDPSKGSNLILLSIATSIDAFAIGLSLAVLNVSILYPSIIIGIVTGLLSVIGIQLGNKLGIKFGKSMEVIGGVILILIGIKILIEHLS